MPCVKSSYVSMYVKLSKKGYGIMMAIIISIITYFHPPVLPMLSNSVKRHLVCIHLTYRSELIIIDMINKNVDTIDT